MPRSNRRTRLTSPSSEGTDILLIDQKVLTVTGTRRCTTAADQLCQEMEMPLCHHHFITSFTRVSLSIPLVSSHAKKKKKCSIIVILGEDTALFVKCMGVRAIAQSSPGSLLFL